MKDVNNPHTVPTAYSAREAWMHEISTQIGIKIFIPSPVLLQLTERVPGAGLGLCATIGADGWGWESWSLGLQQPGFADPVRGINAKKGGKLSQLQRQHEAGIACMGANLFPGWEVPSSQVTETSEKLLSGSSTRNSSRCFKTRFDKYTAGKI